MRQFVHPQISSGLCGRRVPGCSLVRAVGCPLFIFQQRLDMESVLDVVCRSVWDIQAYPPDEI